MKKRNLVLRTAIASALLVLAAGAQAGTLTGTAAYAAENFGPTSTAALAIGAPVIAYTFNTPGGIVINPTGSVFVYLRVSSGKFAAAPVSPTLSAALAGLVATVQGPSTDGTTVRITLNNPTAANITIGIGGNLTWAQGAIQVNSVNTVLNTAGGTVNMQASVGTLATLPDTGTALTADLDNGLSNTLAFATSAEAITGAVAASSSFAVAETQKIDLTATSPASRFTAPGAAASNANSPVLVNLGSVTFTDAGGVQNVSAGAGDYTIAGSSTALTLAGTVTGAFKAGSTMTLATDLACTTAIAAGSAGVPNIGLTTFTFAAGTIPTNAVPNYLCLGVPATVGSIPVTTPTASFTFTKTVATDAADSAAGTLYALTQNGVIRDVRSYIPAATVGYTSFVRVINAGALAAAVTGQWVFEDGSFGTPAVLIASHPANGSVTLTSTQIEAVLGAPAVIGTNRPRLRLSAPTNDLQAQSFFLTNATGDFSDATGAQ